MNKRRASQVHCGNRATQQRELDSIFLQPWFLNKKCASAIRSLVPEAFVHKMRFYFDDWGCLVCRSKKRRMQQTECVTSVRLEFRNDCSCACSGGICRTRDVLTVSPRR